MKIKTPRQLITQAARLDKNMKQAHKELESARRALESAREYWQELPALLSEERQELAQIDSEAAAALAELTKPLERYEYNASHYYRGYETPRYYKTPKAQKAWDTERRAFFKRERIQEIESQLEAGESAYLSEAIRELEEAESRFSALRGMADNLQTLAREIMGRELTPADLTPAAKSDPTPVESIVIPARSIPAPADNGRPLQQFAVMARDLAAALRKNAMLAIGESFYPAKYLREWAQLESGEITITIGGCELHIRSADSRMTLHSQEPARGMTPAPVVFSE